MRPRPSLLIFLSIFLAKLVIAQSISNTDSRSSNNSNEFNFSFFAGGSVLGSKADIESNMSTSGLGQTSPAGWFGDEKAHPFTRSYPIADIEATYYFTKRMGISLNSGIKNNIEVLGYQDIGIGNFMILKNEIWSVSLNYSYRFKNTKNCFFIGPSYFIHSVKEDNGSQSPPQNKNTKFGANIGYSHQILQKKHWFMALKANYCWAPKSEIGPFVTEHQLGIATSNPETYTSVFNPTKVSITCLNFGLCIGLRTAKEN
jgi:hypothetical protein